MRGTNLIEVLQTASSLTFAVYVLTQYPGIMTRLRTEIAQIVGTGQPTYEQIKAMKFLRAFINGRYLYRRIPRFVAHVSQLLKKRSDYIHRCWSFYFDNDLLKHPPHSPFDSRCVVQYCLSSRTSVKKSQDFKRINNLAKSLYLR
ncbi:hypothetical protein H0H87_003546 [Tephrocybe sp. NHM501043]|nr:hypothetical protein H0H87_003546 [Tephrocybe sp. NHM501043]